jgi:hypothetical protein
MKDFLANVGLFAIFGFIVVVYKIIFDYYLDKY